MFELGEAAIGPDWVARQWEWTATLSPSAT